MAAKDQLDIPSEFEPSIGDELRYTEMCRLIDKAPLEELRKVAKDLARHSLCIQEGAIRYLARKAAAGEVIRFRLGGERTE
ncbi:hypothetical protein VZG28_04765 [Synechococcus elongatus IITB4]|uniref:hypothetical protein n=1 Tax=Synechococcus elongatus TaxID=32046 RepID=UPI0030CD3882